MLTGVGKLPQIEVRLLLDVVLLADSICAEALATRGIDISIRTKTTQHSTHWIGGTAQYWDRRVYRVGCQ
jgi:hypothetical protein